MMKGQVCFQEFALGHGISGFQSRGCAQNNIHLYLKVQNNKQPLVVVFI